MDKCSSCKCAASSDETKDVRGCVWDLRNIKCPFMYKVQGHSNENNNFENLEKLEDD